MQKLRAIGQKAYEQKSSRAAFMKRYGRNYL